MPAALAGGRTRGRTDPGDVPRRVAGGPAATGRDCRRRTSPGCAARLTGWTTLRTFPGVSPGRESPSDPGGANAAEFLLCVSRRIHRCCLGGRVVRGTLGVGGCREWNGLRRNRFRSARPRLRRVFDGCVNIIGTVYGEDVALCSVTRVVCGWHVPDCQSVSSSQSWSSSVASRRKMGCGHRLVFLRGCVAKRMGLGGMCSGQRDAGRRFDVFGTRCVVGRGWSLRRRFLGLG